MPADSKRYMLVIDRKLYNDVAAEGRKHDCSFVAEVRRALRLWLMVRRGEVRVTKDGRKVEVL